MSLKRHEPIHDEVTRFPAGFFLQWQKCLEILPLQIKLGNLVAVRLELRQKPGVSGLELLHGVLSNSSA